MFILLAGGLPFSGSDCSGILRGVRSGSSYRRCRRLTAEFRTVSFLFFNYNSTTKSA